MEQKIYKLSYGGSVETYATDYEWLIENYGINENTFIETLTDYEIEQEYQYYKKVLENQTYGREVSLAKNFMDCL